MAIEAQLQSLDQNLGFPQNLLMSYTTTNNNINISPLPPSLNAFDFQQQQPQPQQQECFIQNMGFGQGYVSSPCCSSSTNANLGSLSQPPLSNFPQSLAALLQKQRVDLDHYLLLQGDKLRQILQQQRRQELAILLKNFELKARALLKEKEENIEKLREKTKILEEYLKKAKEETGEWQRIAKQKEEIVIALTNMLEQFKSNLSNLGPSTKTNHEGADENDAESVCDCEGLNKNRRETGEDREIQKIEVKFGVCRWCNLRGSCVVFLPCKHLCCCKICEGVLGLCPVCHCAKQGSIEILLA